MNAEIKQKWVNALRSKEYKQGNGVLRRPATETEHRDTFCCLGVLCDIHAKETSGSWQSGKNRFDDQEHTYFGHKLHMPKEVAVWAGIEPEKYHVCYNGDLDIIVSPESTPKCTALHSLAHANDGGYDFEQIANIIEAQL